MLDLFAVGFFKKSLRGICKVSITGKVGIQPEL